jgi:hypothetical protein
MPRGRLPTYLYLAVGSRDEEQVPRFHQLVDCLSGDQFHNLRLTSKVEAGEGHTAGMIGKAILEGLRTIFKE